jgi:zinc protease
MKTIAASFLLIASAAFVAAQTSTPAAPTATPSVDDVIAHYIDALGGKAAVEKLTSTTVKGTFDIPDFGASGPVEIYTKIGDKSAMSIEIGGFGTVRRGYDGTAGWSDDPQGGLRDLTGDELADMKRGAAYNAALRLKDLYPGLAVKGSDKVNGHDAWVLEATVNDMKHRLYFDAATGLSVRNDDEVKTPDGKGTAVMYFADYKAVDGVQEPFTLTFSSPQLNWNMKLTEVTHNAAIDDAKFAKPAGDAPAPAAAPAPKISGEPAK